MNRYSLKDMLIYLSTADYNSSAQNFSGSLFGHNKRLYTVHNLLVTIGAFLKQCRINFSCTSYLQSVGVHIPRSCYTFSCSFNSPSQNDIDHNEVDGVMPMSNEMRRSGTSTANHPERNINVFINIESHTNCLLNMGTPSKNTYKWKN